MAESLSVALMKRTGKIALEAAERSKKAEAAKKKKLTAIEAAKKAEEAARNALESVERSLAETSHGNAALMAVRVAKDVYDYAEEHVKEGSKGQEK